MPEQNLCVLIDFENVAAGTEKEGLGRFDVRPVMRRLKDKGRILVTRAYGDWGRFAKFKQGLLQQGVQMMELTSFRGQDKNRADIALAVDAMELAFTRDYIDTYVLLSGDSDFTPLVMRLKELNKRVIGIGTRGSTSRLLIEACDEFIFYRNIKRDSMDEEPARHRPRESERRHRPPPVADAPATAEPVAESGDGLSKYDAFSLLVETVRGLQKEASGSLLAGLVKQSLQRKEPTFDESDYGYAGFTRFLESARDKGLLVLSRDDKAGGYRVELPDDGAAPPSPDTDEPDLPVLPEVASALRDTLSSTGFNPLTHFMRHVVVHEFVDHVQERQARKKRNTLMYVHGDIARRCRKTDPYVPARYVTAVINALQAAGELLHSDGNPIRSDSAHFTINKDADELLLSLRRFYLRVLLSKGASLADAENLSLLLWGDTDHQREAGELCAWLVHEANNPPEETEPIEARSVAPEQGEEEEPGGRRRNGRRRNGRRRGRRGEAPSEDSATGPDEVTAASSSAEASSTEASSTEAASAAPTDSGVTLPTGLCLSPPETDGLLEAEVMRAPVAPRKATSRKRKSSSSTSRTSRKAAAPAATES